MNTNLLKRFAQETRKKLIQQVGAKLEWVLQADTPELRENTEQLNALRKALQQKSKEQLIDMVAYTWFNRLVALRFMDVNGYQPLRVQVLSPVTEYGDPEILQMAKQGNFPAELKLNQQHLLDLLDGRVPSANPQNEVYRALLIASCNYLHTIFPFLFERIDDYTELLLPDDLTSELSIINDFIEGMTVEDCQEVEIIGWLYQFYISDRKDEVFAAKGRVEKEDIPAATQLFTPRWIVEYMVQNTVGKLWLQNNPNSSLRDKMPYYIETESSQSEDYLQISSPEEITLLDQACGSGHILVYGFELLYHIYEEAGYTASQIPQLIIEKNLFGYEIDERAAQLASFSVLMKARSYYRRLFRNSIEPNILCFEDLSLSDDEITSAFKALQYTPSDTLEADLITMRQATNYGSLIQPRTSQEELENLLKLIAKKQNIQDAFLKRELDQLFVAVAQLHQLSKKFHCVVQNPPYMGGGKMNSDISDFVRINYADAKADLFSCFIDLSIDRSFKNGLIGNVTMESWMFLSSFEKFRKNLLDNVVIDSLSHFGWHIMRIAFGTVSFILKNSQPKETDKGVYNYLEIDDIDKETECPISFPNIQRRYAVKNQKDFEKIPGNNIGYWLSGNMLSIFSDNKSLDQCFDLKQGMATGDNSKFLRFWFEIANNNIKYDSKSIAEAINSGRRFFPYNKGGELRRWYGNQLFLIKFSKKDFEVLKTVGNHCPSKEFYFKESISWGLVTTAGSSFRLYPSGFIFDVSGMSLFPNDNQKEKLILLGALNSHVISELNNVINPTINLQVGDVKRLPFLNVSSLLIQKIVSISIEISRQEWNSRETSWDFKENELICLHGQDLEEAIDLYKQYWSKKFIELHQNEEELNRQFIEIYGLEEDLDPNVPLEDITILRDELNQKKLKEISEKFLSGWELVDGRWKLVDGEIVDSEWEMVDSELVDENGLINNIKDKESDKRLQGVADMATSDGYSCRSLSTDEENAQGGNLQLDGSNQKIGSKRSEQYSGRASEGDERVYALSPDSSRISRRDGDSIDSNNSTTNAGGGNDQSNLEQDNQSKETNLQLNEQTGRKNQTLTNYPPSTIHQKLSTKNYPPLPFDEKELVIQFISYAVGLMMGRYSLDKPGLILANQGEGISDYFRKVNGEECIMDGNLVESGDRKVDSKATTHQSPSTKNHPPSTKNHPPFMPDADNIIPVLDSEWFEDDIVGQFKAIVKAVWGETNYQRNIRFIEDVLQSDIRKYFSKEFYKDHIKRYKKRPIYWMFSSPKGAFNVLIYMHRYTADTISNILNNYLREFIGKLQLHLEHLGREKNMGTAQEQARVLREIDKIEKDLLDCQQYEREILFDLATERIHIDLDDGVLVNYNKMGKAVAPVAGLNDAASKKKVREFDWIDANEIRG